MTRLTTITRAGVLALAVATSFAVTTPANAATTVPISFDCQAKPPVGDAQQLLLEGAVQAEAPATVAAGAEFEVTVATDPMTVPAEAGGYSVKKLSGVTQLVPVPAGATFVSASLSGGSGLGDAAPTISESNGVVTVKVPGPIAGGATFQMPVVHLTLIASGAVDSTIETHLGGSSYTDPGLTFTATVQVVFFPIDVPTTCFPATSPVLTSTTITA